MKYREVHKKEEQNVKTIRVGNVIVRVSVELDGNDVDPEDLRLALDLVANPLVPVPEDEKERDDSKINPLLWPELRPTREVL